MAEIPQTIKQGDRLSATWLNNVAALAAGNPPIQGKGYSDATGITFSSPNYTAIKGFAKHTADITAGLHLTPIVATQYRAPAWGDFSFELPVEIYYAFGDIKANTLFYYEVFEGRAHASPVECPPE